jgi:choline dehydrogenase-like flavoprotein
MERPIRPGLLAAVADTLFPGVSVEEDGALRADLAPFARAVEARRPGSDFADWSRGDREGLVAELLDGPDSQLGAVLQRVLMVAARSHYADPASWAALGYRPMQPGTSWPQRSFAPPPAITVADLADSYDAVVIGSGAGGGVAACVLAEAGQRVLLVERGQALSRDDLPLDHLRNARVFTGLKRQVDPPPAGNPRLLGEQVVLPGEPLWHNNAMTVGGGTRVYGAQAWRFCPEDFRMGSTYGEPFMDWPISYEDLEPFYDRVEWDVGVCGPDGQRPHDGRRRRGYPMPPLSPNAAQPVLERGARALGMATDSVPLLINSVPRGGRPACIQCGTCVGFACQADAKNGSDNTLIVRAIASGRCHLLPGAVGQRLITEEGGAVVGVALAGDNWRQTVRARHIVLAAGAIETARLLLASQVGTAHDQVGRYLQGHLYAGALGIWDEVVQDSKGPGPSIATTDYRHHNPDLAGGGILVNEFVPIPIEAWLRLTGSGALPAWGEAGLEAMREAYSRTAFVVGPLQEVPLPTSRVTLEPGLKDGYGMPVVRLLGQGPHGNDVRSADLLVQRAQEWLGASGARRLHPVRMRSPRWPSAGQHQAGSCRMGLDPRSSVTDPWGRVWGHAGVTIADGSLHVTNGGVNPVLTILALAWRNSERLAEELAEGRAPEAGGRSEGGRR